ncbi:unnamed protein product [Meloidogyne enterolobii]|uniref:Uncharacterized protein n=1 Tax=Meloidogyne enterolobii TaxID=390850 RepID=A0ACB0YR59_MELEN
MLASFFITKKIQRITFGLFIFLFLINNFHKFFFYFFTFLDIFLPPFSDTHWPFGAVNVCGASSLSCMKEINLQWCLLLTPRN